MGAGALVIVVLLPFLALFLIAVVTAFRRKMKKTSRRARRYKVIHDYIFIKKILRCKNIIQTLKQ